MSATAEAVRIAGTDPDSAQRDLFNAIASRSYPRWTVYIQVMSEADRLAWEARTGWNTFDLTKVWPHQDFPRIPVGVLELNRNPANYQNEVEQAAFSPANIVQGMGYSPDKMLQGRLFAYHDAQLYRVGTNHQHQPADRPRCPFHNQQRDGAMAIAEVGGAQNYDTVQAGGSNPRGFGHGDPGWEINGVAGRYDARGTEDDYTQAGNLFRLLSESERNDLTTNIANAMRSVSAEIKERQLAHFDKAAPAYGKAVREKLKA